MGWKKKRDHCCYCLLYRQIEVGPWTYAATTDDDFVVGGSKLFPCLKHIYVILLLMIRNSCCCYRIVTHFFLQGGLTWDHMYHTRRNFRRVRAYFGYIRTRSLAFCCMPPEFYMYTYEMYTMTSVQTIYVYIVYTYSSIIRTDVPYFFFQRWIMLFRWTHTVDGGFGMGGWRHLTLLS